VNFAGPRARAASTRSDATLRYAGSEQSLYAQRLREKIESDRRDERAGRRKSWNTKERAIQQAEYDNVKETVTIDMPGYGDTPSQPGQTLIPYLGFILFVGLSALSYSFLGNFLGRLKG